MFTLDVYFIVLFALNAPDGLSFRHKSRKTKFKYYKETISWSQSELRIKESADISSPCLDVHRFTHSLRFKRHWPSQSFKLIQLVASVIFNHSIVGAGIGEDKAPTSNDPCVRQVPWNPLPSVNTSWGGEVTINLFILSSPTSNFSHYLTLHLVCKRLSHRARFLGVQSWACHQSVLQFKY